MPTTGKEEDLTTSTPMLVCRPYHVSDDSSVFTTADDPPKLPNDGSDDSKLPNDDSDNCCGQACISLLLLLFVMFCFAGAIIMSIALKSVYPLILWVGIPCVCVYIGQG